MSSLMRIEHKLLVPKSLRDALITRGLGTPEVHIPSDMGPVVPIILGMWGPGSPNWGSPFHVDTGMSTFNTPHSSSVD